MVMPSSPRPGSSRAKVLAVGVVVLILLLVGSAFAVEAFWERTPGEDSAEAGFLRDMQTHHLQAVEMAMIIRDRSDDEQIDAMATDIAFSQTSQIGTMQGFLNIWELNPTGDNPPMAWMGHPMSGLMPGMATEEQIEQLRTLPVHEAETLFLQLMNRHHVAGVEMAEAIIERSDQEDIVEMAESMIRVQSAEIEIMNMFLEERGEAPITTVDADVLTGSDATPGAEPTEDHSGH